MPLAGIRRGTKVKSREDRRPYTTTDITELAGEKSSVSCPNALCQIVEVNWDPVFHGISAVIVRASKEFHPSF